MKDNKRSYDSANDKNPLESEADNGHTSKQHQRTDGLSESTGLDDSKCEWSTTKQSHSKAREIFPGSDVHLDHSLQQHSTRRGSDPSIKVDERNSEKLVSSLFQVTRKICENTLSKRRKMHSNHQPTTTRTTSTFTIDSPNKNSSVSLFGAVMSRSSGPTPTQNCTRETELFSSSSKIGDEATQNKHRNFGDDMEHEFCNTKFINSRNDDKNNSSSMPSRTVSSSSKNNNKKQDSSLLSSPNNRESKSRWSFFPTPTRASNSNNSNGAFSLASPGGHALLKILEQAKTADAFTTSCDDDDAEDDNFDDSFFTKENNDNNFNNNSTMEDDWYYSKIDWSALAVPGTITSIDLPATNGNNTGINFLDKSIKRRIRIECHPGTCLPGVLLEQRRSSMLEQKAKSLFLLSSSTNDFDFGLSFHRLLAPLSLSEQAFVRWMSATMYWQHPAIHPLPREMLLFSREQQASLSSSHRSKGVGTQGTSAHANKAHSSSQPLIKSLVQKSAALFKYVRSVAGVGAMGGLGHSFGAIHSTSANDLKVQKQKKANHNIHDGPVMSSVMIERQKEWRECFRSMYFAWIERIDQWNEQITSSEERAVVDIPMFYAISLGQTILFTCSRPSSIEKKDVYFVPQILISSSTRSLRDQLRRDYDVNLYIGNGKIFKEQDDDHSMDDDALQRNADDTETIEELKALRNAPHAGADVMVLSPHPVRRKNIREDVKCALILYGKKDCHAFYEMYLNRAGNLLRLQNSNKRSTATASRSSNIDVPLLLNRSLGPCLHACLSRLSVTNRKMHDEQMDEASSQDGGTSNNSSVELRGPILPCSVRELLASTVLTLHADCSAKNEEDVQHSAADNDDVGSHYFVAHLQTQEGENTVPSVSNKISGDPSSIWFNGHHNGEISCENNGLDECTVGQVMSVAVWDSARPNFLAYNVDYATMRGTVF